MKISVDSLAPPVSGNKKRLHYHRNDRSRRLLKYYQYGTAGVLGPVRSASVKAGHIVEVDVFDTLSDGTAGGIEPGSITFEPCCRLVDEWVNVSETEIVEGMHWVFKHEGLVVEGAAGVVVAAYLKCAKKLPGSCAALVMCGANIDEEKFNSLVT